MLLKREEIPSGHDPKQYVTRRLFARASDGAEVPVTVLHRADLALGGGAPTLLYGYGAYGHPLSASFDSHALSLVDRGFVYALAHTRGGTDKGWSWYQNGKLEHKTNTFTDFIAAARHLIAAGYAKEGGIVAQGASAGGMLMGAIANQAPELFSGVIAGVPFVDVLNTMLRDDLPLTPPEWQEWGNPIADPVAYDRLAGYSPYDNVAAKAYPAILALAGLTDPRVTYWEPLKWVARLRRAHDRRRPRSAAHQYGGRPRRRLRPVRAARGSGARMGLRADLRGDGGGVGWSMDRDRPSLPGRGGSPIKAGDRSDRRDEEARA